MEFNVQNEVSILNNLTYLPKVFTSQFHSFLVSFGEIPFRINCSFTP